MANSKDYPKLASQAEKAVASIKDAELRRIAFQKILEDLLTLEKEGIPVQPKLARGPSRSGRAKGAAKGAAKARVSRGPQAYIEELVDEAYFKKPKTISQVKAELENRGHHIPMTSLSGPMQKLCQRKVLKRQKAKGESKNKQTYVYSNW